MNKLEIKGLSAGQNSKLNYLHRHLATKLESAKTVVATLSEKLADSPMAASETLYWAEDAFEASVRVEVYQRYLNYITTVLADLEMETVEAQRKTHVEKLGEFLNSYEERINREMTNAVRQNTPTQMQTANIIRHYRMKVFAELLDYIG